MQGNTVNELYNSNKHPVRLSWLENAYSRPLFSAGDFDPESSNIERCVAYSGNMLTFLGLATRLASNAVVEVSISLDV